MKNLFTAILLIVATTLALAQQPVIHCGHDIVLDQMEQLAPGYRESVRQTFEAAKSNANVASRSNNVLEVQVIVHIVWKNPAEHLADSVIEDQIRILNEDYNDLNADQINVRPVFDTVRGNAMIHFNLYEVRRVQTNKTFSIGLTGLPDGTLKSTANGGSDAVDPAHFINIWVCNLGSSGLLGYAFPPNNLPNWPTGQGADPVGYDGLVIDYRAFGGNNPNPLNLQGINFDVKGRTPVHEMGHYLGLRHIWGDNPNPIAALLGLPNDCQQSDGIADTPFASNQSQFDCSHTQDGCTGSESHYGANVPDMVENHMDYSSEACQVMFTKGQVALMRGVLEGPRAGLLEPISTTDNLTGKGVSFSLSPNPSGGLIRLDWDATSASSAQVNVYAPLGALLLSQPSVTPRSTLDLSAFPNGLYLIEVRTVNGSTIRRVIIQPN